MKKVFTLFAFFIGFSMALGQETTSVVGTVTDQSGALVAGAHITVTNQGTGLKRAATTGSTGDYAVPNLPVGTYKITAEMTGFKLGVASDIKLDVQRAARVDFALELGAMTQEVKVTSVAPLLQTRDSQVGTLIENRRIVDLPLNGRNFTQLNLLVPGVVQGAWDDFVQTYSSLGTRGSGIAFAVNGQSSMYNQYLLDGVPIKEVQHQGPGLSPSIDAIQEFRVQTSNYDAQFGSEAGGQINLVTKSGTNNFHGSAYEFVRNDKFDARNFFAPDRAELRQNQFGGTMGGPIKKNNTFFFGGYEGTRIRKGFTQLDLVPNAAERTGDFSDLLAQGIQVKNPYTGTPFIGNQIPQGMLSPVATQVLERFVPLPNFSNPVFNWISNEPNKVGVDQYLGRIDRRFSQSDVLYGRFILDDVRNTSPKLFPTDLFKQASRGQNMALSYSHTFANNKVNEFKMAYNRHFQDEVNGRSYKENVVGELGIQGLCEDPGCWGIPEFRARPFADFSEHGEGQTLSSPRTWWNQIFHFNDAFYWTKGSHLIRFGMEVNRHQDTFLEAANPRGRFRFQGKFTSPDGRANSSTALADFLLGLPDRIRTSIDIFNPYFRNTVLYPWFQDDWRVTPDLTLNLALSYWWFGRPQSKNNTIANVDLSGDSPQLLTAANAAESGWPRSLMNNDNNNFAPRVGFAYAPRNHKRFVVRGGYGVFYQRASANNWIGLSINAPFIRSLDYRPRWSDFLTYNIQTILTHAQAAPLSGANAMDRNWRDAYIQGWNLTTQYQPTTNTVITLGYVGNKDAKLSVPIGGYDVNMAVPGPGDLQSRRRWPDFGGISYVDASIASSYHSLQADVRRQFSNGLSFLAGYTWSKCMDTGDHGSNFQDIRHRANKGLCDIDARQRFVISYIYELPFGPGKPFASNVSGPLKHVVAGWQVNGITTFASGQPVNTEMGADWADVGSIAYPDLTGNPNLSGSARTLTHYFNTEAFSAPPEGTFGSAGRNVVIGPGINNFDFALLKKFPIREETHLEFRAEIFNIFNHANFILPEQAFLDPTFGVISGARDPRDIQFGLKLIF